MVGYTAAKQEQMIGEAITYVEREAWMRSLRPGDVAKIARLSLLAVPRTENGPSPSTDFAVCLFRLLKRGVVIVEAETGITSDDVDGFAGAVEKAANQISAGRRLTPARARKMGEAARNIMIERSATTVLAKPEMRRWLNPIRAMWSSVEFASRAAAADAVNAMLRDAGLAELGSPRTIERAFEALGQPLRRR